ncbi:unnamed protein product [Allacma fusca]|uniref:Caspase-1 n=1 Tax=Allacma fusca TaxID=39272 RepID=A0A8J2L716_9HEXA|nr:unnamed protein product [Allacma fusca]
MSKLLAKWFGGKKSEEPSTKKQGSGSKRKPISNAQALGDFQIKMDETDGKNFSKSLSNCPRSRPKNGKRRSSGETLTNASVTDGLGLSVRPYDLPEMPVSKDNPYYNMDHPDRGKAIIFNFDKWDNTTLPALTLSPREGSTKDKNDLKNCLEDLDFDVHTHDNLDTHQFWDRLRELRDEDHRLRDCLVVAIMTHGEKNHIYVKDGTLIPVNLIWEEFEADKCPTLAGKPKIFIIQACRGSSYDNGTRLYGSQEFIPSPRHNDVTDAAAFSYVIPNAADIFVAFSCPLGQYSWRNRYEGSWFIQAVCKVLREEAYNTDLQTLFTHVAREVAVNKQSSTTDPASDKKVQVTSSSSTLIRIVQFRRKMMISPPPEIDDDIEPFENIMRNNRQLLPPPSSFLSSVNEGINCGHVNAVMEIENCESIAS